MIVRSQHRDSLIGKLTHLRHPEATLREPPHLILVKLPTHDKSWTLGRSAATTFSICGKEVSHVDQVANKRREGEQIVHVIL